MPARILLTLLLSFILFNSFGQKKELLIYHPIQTDQSGKIIPWYDENPGKSYDHTIDLVWNFWDTMRLDMNGLPYYMNHQVWNPAFNDPRGIGGDQFAMAISSWRSKSKYVFHCGLLFITWSVACHSSMAQYSISI